MTSPEASTTRSAAVDILRGLALILMALDHARVYSGISAAGSTADVFFTRWVTHFCAPTFLFLSGVSLFLSSRAARPSAALSKLLVIRGLWLIFLELSIIRLAWTFNFDHDENLLGGVIWAIGWCMILMAGIVHLPRWGILLFGLLVMAGHNVIGTLYLTESPWQAEYPWLFRVLYAGGWIELSEELELDILYSIVPWVGVMATGYAFAPIFSLAARQRDRLCYGIAAGMILLFVALRLSAAYGDPSVWPEDYPGLATWLSFLAPQKYPASLQFLLMTLGPAIVLIPLLEKSRGRITAALATIGRVPMFFYLLHIPLIHLLALLIALVRSPESVDWLFDDHPLLRGPVPEGYVYGIGLLYLLWAAACALLYMPCAWYARIRPRLPKAWRNLI